MRPEKVAKFGPGGHPFYCGKTVTSPDHRLSAHRYEARKHPNTPHSTRMAECGEHLHMRIIEVVPAENDWCARERFWIAAIRRLYPGGTNILAGGQGAPGWIPSAEFREKARIARCERNRSPEQRAKTSAALKGRKASPETCARISDAKRGLKHSPESNAKRSATQSGRTRSLEANAKTAAGLRGRKRSPEECANISAGKRGKRRGPHSSELRAKMSAARKAWWANPINHERASTRQIGRVLSVETREKIGTSQRARLAKAAHV